MGTYGIHYLDTCNNEKTDTQLEYYKSYDVNCHCHSATCINKILKKTYGTNFLDTIYILYIYFIPFLLISKYPNFSI